MIERQREGNRRGCEPRDRSIFLKSIKEFPRAFMDAFTVENERSSLNPFKVAPIIHHGSWKAALLEAQRVVFPFFFSLPSVRSH